jgi:hypothetical protein
MELKNAVAVCLISLFSATLVLLIAWALDLQATARLEPQLTRIVEELEALRKQGGIASAGLPSPTDASRVIVYYLHSSARCPTCRAVESQAYEVVQSDFAAELKSGAMTWRALNYEEPAGAELAKKFEVASFAVVLAKMEGGEIVQWKKLDRAGALVGNKPRYAAYVRDAIRQMIHPAEPQPTVTSVDEKSPTAASVAKTPETTVSAPADLPIPE